MDKDEIKSNDPPVTELNHLIKLLGENRLTQVLDETSVLLKHFPKSITLYHIMGAANNSLGNFDASTKNFEQAISVNPSHAESYYNLGTVLQAQGKLSQALGAYKNAINNKRDFAEAYNNTGNLLKEQGNINKAIASYKKALAVKSDYAEVFVNLGNVYKEQGKLEKAVKTYNDALGIKPDYAEALFNIGFVFHEQGKLDEAFHAYYRALTIKPAYAEAYLNIANVLQDQERPAEAISALEKALSIFPDYFEAFLNLGVILKDQGRLHEATQAYNKALLVRPQSAETHSDLGALLREQRKPEAAIKACENAISIKPNYADAFNNMGSALLDQGKFLEAIKVFEKAIIIDPQHFEAWNNIYYPLHAIKAQNAKHQKPIFRFSKKLNSKNIRIAKAILDCRLNLGSDEIENFFNKAVKIVNTADNIIIKNPSNKKKLKGMNTSLPDKVIALTHFGRSGTGLLHSLIDGHPEVSTLPSIYFSQFFDHSNWVKIISGGWSKIPKHFMEIYEVLFDASARMAIETKSKKLIYSLGKKEGMANLGEHKNEVLVLNKKRFSSALSQLMNDCDELDAFKFFKLVHAAYDKATNDRQQKTLVFYHIHNPDTYAQVNFSGLSSNVFWILTVREPLQSCESWLLEDFKRDDYDTLTKKMFQILFEIDNIMYREHYSVGVRLEDLKENPGRTIPALCKWMGIRENKSLYEMTAQGKKWWGDPSSPDFTRDGMNPFSNTSIRRKVGLIFSENDQFILQTLFYPFCVQFGYVQENQQQFKRNLRTIEPMLSQMFDFEKLLADRTLVNHTQFMKTGPYLYLRSGLIERWNTLNKYHTYPNMIRPLKIA